MLAEHLDMEILQKMKMPTDNEPDLKKWEEFLYKHKHPKVKLPLGWSANTLNLKMLINPSTKLLFMPELPTNAKSKSGWFTPKLLPNQQ